MKQRFPLPPLEATLLFSHASYDTSAMTSNHLATGGTSQMLNNLWHLSALRKPVTHFFLVPEGSMVSVLYTIFTVMYKPLKHVLTPSDSHERHQSYMEKKASKIKQNPVTRVELFNTNSTVYLSLIMQSFKSSHKNAKSKRMIGQGGVEICSPLFPNRWCINFMIIYVLQKLHIYLC